MKQASVKNIQASQNAAEEKFCYDASLNYALKMKILMSSNDSLFNQN